MEFVIIAALFGSIGFVGIIDFIERKLKGKKNIPLRVEACDESARKKAC